MTRKPAAVKAATRVALVNAVLAASAAGALLGSAANPGIAAPALSWTALPTSWSNDGCVIRLLFGQSWSGSFPRLGQTTP